MANNDSYLKPYMEKQQAMMNMAQGVIQPVQDYIAKNNLYSRFTRDEAPLLRKEYEHLQKTGSLKGALTPEEEKQRMNLMVGLMADMTGGVSPTKDISWVAGSQYPHIDPTDITGPKVTDDLIEHAIPGSELGSRAGLQRKMADMEFYRNLKKGGGGVLENISKKVDDAMPVARRTKAPKKSAIQPKFITPEGEIQDVSTHLDKVLKAGLKTVDDFVKQSGNVRANVTYNARTGNENLLLDLKGMPNPAQMSQIDNLAVGKMIVADMPDGSNQVFSRFADFQKKLRQILGKQP